MRTWHWILLITVAFAMGLVSGKRWGDRDADWVVEAAPAAATRAAVPLPAAVPVAGFAEAVTDRDWAGLVDLLEQANHEGRDQDHAALYEGMRRVAADLVAAEATDDAVDLLARYAALNPGDNDVRFQWAEALAASGDFEGALRPVLDIIESPLTTEEQAEAMALRESLVQEEVARITADALEQQQAQDPALAVEVAADPLIALYQNLVEREPLNDQHRLALAEAYLAANRQDDALSVLDEIAGYGVDTATVAALRDSIIATGTEPELQRRDRSLLANVQAAGRNLNLLLDTGATQTALSPDALARIGAQPLRRLARVNTAAGAIEVPVYEVAEFIFGGQRFETLEVIALADVPRQTDGLLGMDVLGQLQEVTLQP
jgi:thioredoxin-like negative regulator of GroEL